MFDRHIEMSGFTKDDMFLLFDYVHLLKNIRNNWITEKIQKLSFELNCEQMNAKWSNIKKLHQLEINNLVKMSKLSQVAVRPKPIERQKYQLFYKSLVMKR